MTSRAADHVSENETDRTLQCGTYRPRQTGRMAADRLARESGVSVEAVHDGAGRQHQPSMLPEHGVQLSHALRSPGRRLRFGILSYAGEILRHVQQLILQPNSNQQVPI